jgi:hypothetical protein
MEQNKQHPDGYICERTTVSNQGVHPTEYFNDPSKYYTPSIEEFHVGFECERTDNSLPPQWNKIVTSSSTINDVIFWNDHKQRLGSSFRVKYLDRQDIESLGFTFMKDLHFDQGYSEYLKEPGYRIVAGDQYKGMRVHIWGLGVYEFNGRVKNKSELKVLLKQLGINE